MSGSIVGAPMGGIFSRDCAASAGLSERAPDEDIVAGRSAAIAHRTDGVLT
jgi:hypothetical protein